MFMQAKKDIFLNSHQLSQHLASSYTLGSPKDEIKFSKNSFSIMLLADSLSCEQYL